MGDLSLPFRVDSEFALLRAVLVHSPGPERLQAFPTPMHDLEREAHHALKQILIRQLGSTNVHELRRLLIDVLELGPQVRSQVLRSTLGRESARYTDYLARQGIALHRCSAERIANDLIEGVGDAREHQRRSVLARRRRFPSLPSIMWMRDSTINTPAGLFSASTRKAHRAGEPRIVRAVMMHHPMFAQEPSERGGSGITSWPVAGVEGGAVVIVGPHALAVSLSARTAREWRKARRRAIGWIEASFRVDRIGALDRVYLVRVLPCFDHLDSIFSVLGARSALAMPFVLDDVELRDRLLPCWEERMEGELRSLGRLFATRLRPGSLRELGATEIVERVAGGGGVRVVPCEERFVSRLLKDGLLERERLFWVGGERSQYSSPEEHLLVALREQAQQAANLLALAPFHFVAFDHNPATLASLGSGLRRIAPSHRIETIPRMRCIEAQGGPRCLAAPLARELESSGV